MKRRDFLAVSGATGLLLFFRTDPLPAQETERVAPRPSYPADFNAYLRIAPDGGVDCFVGKVELGQGSMTALALLLAEELDVPVKRVRMTMGTRTSAPGTWAPSAPSASGSSGRCFAARALRPGRCSWSWRRNT